MKKTTPQSLPLYVQISENLIRDVQSGRLLDGERLPPEREMADQLGIAVGTLRKALADLVEKGMLERVQGSGNYIRANADAKAVYSFFRVELLEGGGLPTADLISVETLNKPDHLPMFGASRVAHRIRRLRRLNGKPAVLEEIWLDGSYIQTLGAQDLSDSLYLFYREKLGLWIQRAEDTMDVGEAPDWAPDSFSLKNGQHCLLAKRRSWDGEGLVAEISFNWIDTSVATYVSRLK